MNLFLSFLLFFSLTIKSTGTVNPNKNGSFLNLLTPEVNLPDQDLGGQEDKGNNNENETKRSKSGVLESIANLFRNQDKTGSKTHNNAVTFDFVGFKNVRGKKEVENTHLQVQKASNLFTNNTEKGVLHFTTRNKLNGNVVKATFKLTKLFDAKNLGFKCPSNSVKLYLIDKMGDDMKTNVLKGPLKVEFKKNDMEVDVTKFFDDLEGDNSPRGPSMLQFTDLTPGSAGDEELVFDDDGTTDTKKTPNTKEDDFFGKEGENETDNDETTDSTNGGNKTVDTYLMLEADPECYFGFDVENNKPKVRLELSRKTTFKIKGTVKKGAVGVGVASVVAVLGLGVYLFKKNRRTDYTYFYDNQPNEIMAGV